MCVSKIVDCYDGIVKALYIARNKYCIRNARGHFDVKCTIFYSFETNVMTIYEFVDFNEINDILDLRVLDLILLYH